LVNPCWKCTERYSGCHSVCEKYKAFAEENEKRKMERYKSFPLASYMVETSKKKRESYMSKIRGK